MYFQILCSGEYYEGWLTEKKPPPFYEIMNITCFFLNLLLNIIIGIKKARIGPKKPLQADGPIGKIIAKKHKNNLQNEISGTLTSWAYLVPVLLQMALIQNLGKSDPIILNDFPNNVKVYLNHLFFPTLIAILLCILFFSQSRELRRALKDFFFGQIIPEPSHALHKTPRL